MWPRQSSVWWIVWVINISFSIAWIALRSTLPSSDPVRNFAFQGNVPLIRLGNQISQQERAMNIEWQGMNPEDVVDITQWASIDVQSPNVHLVQFFVRNALPKDSPKPLGYRPYDGTMVAKNNPEKKTTSR